MKFERISENQIRCTLSKQDLEENSIQLNELAYGSDKARQLLQDMMQQAKETLGFEVDDAPLMIEAIPVNPDSLILLITKVEKDDDASAESRMERIKNIIGDAVHDLAEQVEEQEVIHVKDKKKERPQSAVFMFRALDRVIDYSKKIENYYDSENSLYKSTVDNRYYLYMTKNKNNDEEFARSIYKATEYAVPCRVMYATGDFFDEHFEVIIKDEALQMLAEI